MHCIYRLINRILLVLSKRKGLYSLENLYKLLFLLTEIRLQTPTKTLNGGIYSLTVINAIQIGMLFMHQTVVLQNQRFIDGIQHPKITHLIMVTHNKKWVHPFLDLLNLTWHSLSNPLILRQHSPQTIPTRNIAMDQLLSKK